MRRNVRNALPIGSICLVLFFFLTQPVASQENRPTDVLIYTGSVWWISRPDAITEAQTTQRLLEAEGIEVEITENANAVKQWMLSTASDGAVNVLILYGSVPSTIYPSGNVQPDGSVAESWIETSDGNTILNHADWIFYANNGVQGLENLMDIPEILLWGDDTPMRVTASGKALTPSLTAFRSDRPLPLNQLQGDWFAETVFASDTGAADATRADPVIVRDGNRGRIAIVHQTHFEENPKGEVAAEIINYLLADADVETDTQLTDEEVLQPGRKIEGPWLWMVVPTVQGGEAAATSGEDSLAAASGGTVTEQQIASKGATAGEAVGDSVWTSGRLAPTGGNNIKDLVNAIGFGEDNININNRVAYGSIVLNAPREQNTKMWVGSDDAAKVWLNGTLVHTQGVGITRGTNDYSQTFPVTLKKDKNVLFVAVYYKSGRWSGFFGFENDAAYTRYQPPVVHVTAAERPPLYWIDKTAGTLHRLVEEKVEDLGITVQNATCLAVDTANSKLYWAEKTGKQTGRIRRANLDGTNVNLVKELTSLPVDIALDTENQKLYLISAWGKVQRVNFDGSNFQPNLITNLEAPDHLALDLTGDKIYWTEQTGETTGSIRRANLDGSNVELVKSLTSIPHGLNMDTVNRKLYLTNAWGKVQHLNFNGSNYRPNFITDLDAPDDLAVDAPGGQVYWTERSGRIRRADLNGENIEDLVTRAGLPIQLVLSISPAPAAVAAAPAKAGVPDQTLLFANYPNPFNPETWIPYQLAAPTDVKVTIYDARGILVRHLELGHQLAGTYTRRSRAAYWDGRNAQGEQVASGIYFYQLETDEMSSLRKMVILK